MDHMQVSLGIPVGEVASHQAVACCNGRLQGTDSWRSLLSA